MSAQSCKPQANASIQRSLIIVYILYVYIYIFKMFIALEVGQNKFHFCLSAFTLIVHCLLLAVCLLEILWSLEDITNTYIILHILLGSAYTLEFPKRLQIWLRVGLCKCLLKDC